MHEKAEALEPRLLQYKYRLYINIYIDILFFIDPYTFNSWLFFMILGNGIHTE